MSKRTAEPRIDCDEVLRQLLAWLDHEVEAPTASLIERHLEHCRACFSRAQFERRLKGHLRAAAEKPAPARLRLRVKDILERF